MTETDTIRRLSVFVVLGLEHIVFLMTMLHFGWWVALISAVIGSHYALPLNLNLALLEM